MALDGTYLVTTKVCPFTSKLASGFSASFPGRSLKMRICGSCMNWPKWDKGQTVMYVGPEEGTAQGQAGNSVQATFWSFPPECVG